jgi:hypothetical protein
MCVGGVRWPLGRPDEVSAVDRPAHDETVAEASVFAHLPVWELACWAAERAAPEALAAYLAERTDPDWHGTLDFLFRDRPGTSPRRPGDPTADVNVAAPVLRGLCRVMGAAPRSQAARAPSTSSTRSCPPSFPGTAIGARDCAVIVLGYASVLRLGEVSALRPRRHHRQARRKPKSQQ